MVLQHIPLEHAAVQSLLPEPFVDKDFEFHFLRSGRLLGVALETGIHYLGCKLCFVSRCLRFESRIDPSEAMVLVTSYFQFSRCSFSSGSKLGAKPIGFRFDLLVSRLEAQQMKQVNEELMCALEESLHSW